MGNYKLNDLYIINIRRSNTQMETVELDIDCSTPVATVRQLDLEYKCFLRSRPELFLEGKSEMFVRGVQEMSRLRIAFYTNCNTNFQYGEHMFRRLRAIKTCFSLFLLPEAILSDADL
eukprot:m.584741 g.584741  ORF g.584741 m.584741 type:complete len:118 (+) comp57965_c0_seq40:147-500(+)